jgi:decaprenylphospho-beta-D-ribofuranose 2-oxidase
VTTVSSWSGSAHSRSDLLSPADDRDWERLFADPPQRGVTVRGLGRSYGDAALNSGGTVAWAAARGGARLLDGVLEADAGTSIQDALRVCLPAGWMLPVVPGTGHVSLGGALAADVHGKNHRRRGSLSAHVLDAVLLTPALGPLLVGPEREPEAFWATAGGLGLTGVLRRLRIRLVPVATAWLATTDQAASGLDHALALMEAVGRSAEYVVAWLDGHATGRATGRGIVSTGRHLDAGELPQRLRAAPLTPGQRHAVPVPPLKLGNLVRPGLVRALNGLRYGCGAVPRAGVHDVLQALTPLDAAAGWPRLYGANGFVQYQFVVPLGAERLLRRCLQVLQAAGRPPALAVLKRLGAASPAPLGFALPGWTLALDLPADRSGRTGRCLDELDDLVAAAGGRVYLVKDARMRAETVAATYPGLDRWRQVRARLDPHRVLVSDLARRLALW